MKLGFIAISIIISESSGFGHTSKAFTDNRGCKRVPVNDNSGHPQNTFSYTFLLHCIIMYAYLLIVN